MPATIQQPAIPVPTKDNIVPVLHALRNAVITNSNTDAGRANASGTVPPLNSNILMSTPSQFNVTSEVVVPVTYSVPIAGATGATASVTVPQIQSITWTNATTGQTIVWVAPGKLFTGGAIGAAL